MLRFAMVLVLLASASCSAIRGDGDFCATPDDPIVIDSIDVPDPCLGLPSFGPCSANGVARTDPSVILEGMGSAPEVPGLPIVFHGRNFTDDMELELSFERDGVAFEAGAITVNAAGTMAAVELRVPVVEDFPQFRDQIRTTGDLELRLVRECNRSEAQVLSVAALPEAFAASGLELLYSRIDIEEEQIIAGVDDPPVRLIATSSIVVDAPIRVVPLATGSRNQFDCDARVVAGGCAPTDLGCPASCQGSAPCKTGLATGGGGHASPGGSVQDCTVESGGCSGPAVDNLAAVPLRGGGGGGCLITLLPDPLRGGGGGGIIEVTSLGSMVWSGNAELEAPGADGSCGNLGAPVCLGAGAGGSLLVRARHVRGRAELNVRGGASTTLDDTSGGAGSAGRLRVDFAAGDDVEDWVASLAAERALVGDELYVRGPSIDLERTVTDDPSSIREVDGAMSLLWHNQFPVEAVTLTPGLNSVCMTLRGPAAHVPPENRATESLNCVWVAYVD